VLLIIELTASVGRVYNETDNKCLLKIREVFIMKTEELHESISKSKNKFKLIETKKKERLINCAFEEFGTNTFEKASTNRIVKNANVSRGLLYHYFENKQDLYDSLKTFAYEEMLEALQTKVKWEDADILLRIKQIVLIKMEVAKRYPAMLQFLTKMSEDMSFEEAKQWTEDFAPGFYEQIYTKNIDFALFKDDVDVGRAIKVIMWTIEKYSEEYQNKLRTENFEMELDTFINELNEYIKLFRTTFYK